MKTWCPIRLMTTVGLICALAACTTVQTPAQSDPLEGMNRTVFRFNETVDRYAFKPVAKTYKRVVPRPIRTSVTNFFANIGDFYTALNNVLQGNMQDGAEDLMRISINSFLGIGGLFDVATPAGLPKHQQDFGLTLGHYGVPAGPYLVLPLLGPSTVRDTAGFVVDRVADPTTYIQPNRDRNAVYGLRLVSTRASLLEAGDLLSQVALDKYSFIRDAYLQRRRYSIRSDNDGFDYDDDDDDDQALTPSAVDTPQSALQSADKASASGATTVKSGSSRKKSTSKSTDDMVVPPFHIMPPSNYLPSLSLP